MPLHVLSAPGRCPPGVPGARPAAAAQAGEGVPVKNNGEMTIPIHWSHDLTLV